jgi:Ca-activated chloride channel family protein
MKPNHLEEMLKQDAPAPDPAARVAARRAALTEFARAQQASAAEAAPTGTASVETSGFQALLGRLRLSREPTSGRDFMPWYSRRMVLGGAASVCIALVGSVVVWNAMRGDPMVAELGRETAATAMVDDTAAPAGEAATEPATEGLSSLPADSSTASFPAAGELREQLAKQQIAEKAEGDKRRASAAQSRAEGNARAPAAARPDASGNLTQGGPMPAIAGNYPVTTAPAPAEAEPLPPPPPLAAADAAAKVKDGGANEEVVVTGARRSLRASSEVKREAYAVAIAPAAPEAYQDEGRDRFEHFEVNPVKRAVDDPVSTFSVDVDTASYSFVRRQLNAGLLPQKDAVRVEEMINYFSYDWPAASNRSQPFKPTVVVSDSPWGRGKKLVHIGIKGYEIPPREQPDSNLVLLLDVSGSMNSPDKLPLAVQSMELLLGSLKPADTVAIVVYAGSAGTVLEPTEVREKEKIVRALRNLNAGGSTAGAEGIRRAYELAEARFRKGGVNRVLLATDGDFNVGIDSTQELKGFIERQRDKGIFLSVLGFGMGNYRDELAQALAQNGNGVAAYIDSLAEARKVLVKEATGSLFTIAKDVKLQVEFNEDTVAEYRLVGYETRKLNREDFNNDAVDAGDVGAGHTVTAIYEITPVGSDAVLIDERRFGKDSKDDKVAKPRGDSGLYGFLKIRYKLPDGKESKLIEQPIEKNMPAANADVKRDVSFSTAVAGFAQLLRGGNYTGSLTLDDVIEDAQASTGSDADGYRAEFVQLARKARSARGM